MPAPTISKSQAAIALEDQYSAHNYHPIPVCFAKASGSTVWDSEGKEYIDCLAGYGALNQGHCHPKIVKALVDQAQKLTLSSRAFHSDLLGAYSKKVTELLGFESVLPMNTGAEAVETAMKLARKWAYEKKGVPENEAIILSAADNFHGRTLGVISMSTDPDSRVGFGPFLDNVGPSVAGHEIRYGNIEDLKLALEKVGDKAAAFLVEPVQGEAGIVIPPAGYLNEVAALCKKYNVLVIADEIQSGLGRTGKMLAYEHHEGFKPDIVTIAKALSGGVYPVAAVLSSKEIMHVIQPGQHGSTYGGNPLACAVAMAALDVLVDEKLSERSAELGAYFYAGLLKLQKQSPWITEVRGVGLMTAIVIDKSKSTKGRGAWDVCLLAASKGLLAKPTHEHIIRLTPPLVITKEEIDRTLAILKESLDELDTVETLPFANGH